jgi:hypothetical protein
MRQLLMDEIPVKQMEEVNAYLKEKAEPSGLDKIFWLEVPRDILAPVQWEHQECGPHYLAIEVGKDFLKFELLVRSRNRLRCDCVQYATPAQETFLIKFVHTLIESLALQG